MKQIIQASFILCIILCVGKNLSAQEVIRQKSCDNISIKRQADSMKSEMSKIGFALLREASMTMESDYEMPVIVPMNEGSWYHVVFIGDESSKLLELRMFDWQEKQVIYQKSKNDMIVDGNGNNNNILNYTYASKFSEYHMIKPVQINKKKKKDLCGYIMLFKRTK
jgi:hypothetical protein